MTVHSPKILQPKAFNMNFLYLYYITITLKTLLPSHLFQIYSMPDMLEERWGHSINVIGACDSCVWVMVTGGIPITPKHPDIILFELSELCNVPTSKQTLISKEIRLILTSILCSHTCMLHVQIYMYSAYMYMSYVLPPQN